MWLIVGLGNPGAEYALTRHNIGFMVIDRMAGSGGFSRKFQSDAMQTTLGGESVLLLKPQTFMNLSGRAVQAAMAFYKLPPSQLIVLHDELDLPLGKLRVKKGGGANGHNGIRDIDQMIGPDYWRVRLGIGHPGDKAEVHAHVLKPFSRDEAPRVAEVVDTVAAQLPLFWQHSPETMASKIAAILNPPPPKKPKDETRVTPGE